MFSTIQKYIGQIGRYLVPANVKYKDVIKRSTMRIWGIITFLSLIFSILVLKLFFLTILPDKDIRAYYTKDEPQIRQNITDRNGIIIANTLLTDSVYINPNKVKNPKKLALRISKILINQTYETLYKKIIKNNSYVILSNKITPQQKYDLNAIGDISIDFKKSFSRLYPHKNLFSHILGYVNADGKGVIGLEKAFDKELQSTAFSKKITLDTRLQHIVHSELDFITSKVNAKGGFAVIADVTNGEVLSMVSLPDFNPNYPGKTLSHFNPVAAGVYELGSMLKLINIAMGLESGKVSLNDKFDATKPMQIGGFTIKDLFPRKRILTLAEIILYSSNIASARLALKAGVQFQKHFLKQLGLLKKPSYILPEKAKPLYPKKWGETHASTIAFGHGIAISPLHLIAATIPMVNGGIYYTLQFEQQSQHTGNRVISKKTSDVIRKLMYLNNTYGSGRNGSVKGYMVGGKTGSAEKPNKKGTYNKKDIIASYLGVFPIHKPKYIILVSIDTPQSTEYIKFRRPRGGVIAAPTVSRIIQRIAPLLNISPVDKNSANVKSAITLENIEKMLPAIFKKKNYF